MVPISLNGEEKEIPAGLTVRGLLTHLGLDERRVVVERNREIVRRSEYDDVAVGEADEIEVVHFVGGG